MKHLIIVAGMLCLANVAVRAETTAFVGARLHPVDARVIEDGVLLIDDDRISGIGPRGGIRIPGDATATIINGIQVSDTVR